MITYKKNEPLDVREVVRVFDSSGISRPTSNQSRIQQMFEKANLVVSAWDEARLVGVCRALTDYCYCCYLSDLAVESEYQGRGIGRELLSQVRSIIGDQVTLVLLSAPDAMSFYPPLGLKLADNAYVIRRVR
jgi:GNAT superfamily N-acetyltransferase